jgi:UDP-glucose 4-epimerase
VSRILVTGAAGFIGSHLCRRLLAEGDTVCGVDDLSGGDRDNLPSHVDLKFWKMDCCDFAGMNDVMRSFRPEVVYHCAAYPHEGLSIFSPCAITQNTFDSSVSVATAAVAAGVRRLVNMSSMARYGAQPVPFTEDMPPRPVDPYGVAKVAAEQTLSILGRAHGLEVVHLVPHSVIGPYQRRHDPYRNVVAIMMNRMMQDKQPVIYGDGEQVRCFSFISDALGSIVRAGFWDGLDGEVVNIGPDEEFVTVNTLAELVAEAMGFPLLEPIYLPDRPCEVKLAYCSSAKARRVLNYHTAYTLRKGLAEMAVWAKRVGPRPFEYHLPVELDRSPILPRTWRERMF